MHIAMFSESYLPYVSGVTSCIHTLTQELVKQGHHVDLFVPHYPPAERKPPRRTDEQLQVYRFLSFPAGMYPEYRLTLPFSRHISHRLRTTPYDVVHTHSPFQLGWLAKRVAKKNKARLIFSFHTLLSAYLHYIPLLPAPLSQTIMKSYLQRFCRHCDAIIAPSQAIKAHLQEEGMTTPTIIIPTGVDLSVVKASQEERHKRFKIRKNLGRSETDILLLYTGRIAKEKNLPFLFYAITPLLKKLPHVHFLLAGCGPYEGAAKALVANQDIASQVHFLGKISRDEIFHYYHACDLFAFASKSETQGLVITEAKACGLPAVVLDAQGVGGAIQHGKDGFLVPEHASPSQFAEKIELLLTNPILRQQFSHEARSHAFTHLSAETMTSQILNLYLSQS